MFLLYNRFKVILIKLDKILQKCCCPLYEYKKMLNQVISSEDFIRQGHYILLYRN